jgi:hypothetical protein
MAVSKINGKSIRVATIIFTYVNYNLWYPSSRDSGVRILQGVGVDYGIIGDGTTYCSLIKRDSTAGATVKFAPASDSPLSIDCLVIPN